MDFEAFQQLSISQVADLMRQAGSTVGVFPINGTRRWFALEHPTERTPEAYLQIAWQKHIEIYQLCFDHGLDTLLTPIFGPELLERGEAYRQMVEPGLLWLAQNEAILDFYERYDVRVRIYGDIQRYFRNTPYEHILDVYAQLAERTAAHQSRRLYFGVCAHDPSETVAQIGVRHFQDQGRLPDRREIITAYYGEYVEPVALFIGFDRPSVFDMPLIATGREDLYFMVSPSLYLEATTLRAILYDHLYARRVGEAYEQLSKADWQTMQEFYRVNRGHVLGVGFQAADGNLWYPSPQVTLLSGMRD